MLTIQEITNLQNQFLQDGNNFSPIFRLGALASLEGAIKEFEKELYRSMLEDFGGTSTEIYSMEIAPILKEIHQAEKKLKYYMRKIKNRSKGNYLNSQTLPFPSGSFLFYSSWKNPIYSTIFPLISIIALGNTATIVLNEKCPKTSKVLQTLITTCYEPEFIHAVLNEEFKECDQPQNCHLLCASTKDIPNIENHENLLSLFSTGRNFVIIEEDADLSVAAKEIVFAKFRGAGQTYFAPDIVLINPNQYALFCEEIQKSIVQFYGENPLNNKDYSIILTNEMFLKIENHLQKENIVFGGECNHSELKIEPTIVKINELSETINNEIIGPILSILTTDDWRKTIDLIRLREFSFFVSYFTNKKSKHAPLLSLPKAAIVCVNHCPDPLFDTIPIQDLLAGDMYSRIAPFSRPIVVNLAPNLKKKEWLYPPYSSDTFSKIKGMVK